MQVARLGVRVLVGGLFMAHGTQKLFGWFGGPGIPGTTKMMASLDLYPPKANAYAAGISEAGSGLLFALGLGTPAASAGLIGVMTTAIKTVHWKNGFWNSKGGYEYNLVLIAALAAMAESGAGDLSLDHLLGLERKGTRYALAATAVGVTGSLITVGLGHAAAKRYKAANPPLTTPGPAPTAPVAPATGADE